MAISKVLKDGYQFLSFLESSRRPSHVQKTVVSEHLGMLLGDHFLVYSNLHVLLPVL